jgi:hypothetical protein
LSGFDVNENQRFGSPGEGKLGTRFANNFLIVERPSILRLFGAFRRVPRDAQDSESGEVIVMLSHLGLLEIDCDAPPYPIVRACRKLGLSEPEDVRWCRRSHQTRRRHSWIHFLASPIWGRLLGRGEEAERACNCGRPLPELDSYSFTFQTGEQVEYDVGQCPYCRTIYWEKI